MYYRQVQLQIDHYQARLKYMAQVHQEYMNRMCKQHTSAVHEHIVADLRAAKEQNDRPKRRVAPGLEKCTIRYILN